MSEGKIITKEEMEKVLGTTAELARIEVGQRIDSFRKFEKRRQK